MAAANVLPPLQETRILLTVAMLSPTAEATVRALPSMTPNDRRFSQMGLLVALIESQCSRDLVMDFLDLMVRGEDAQPTEEEKQPAGEENQSAKGCSEDADTFKCSHRPLPPKAKKVIPHVDAFMKDPSHRARLCHLYNTVVPIVHQNAPAAVLASMLDMAYNLHRHIPPETA